MKTKEKTMKTKIEELEAYFNMQRQAGHTTAVIRGAAAVADDKKRTIIIAHNEEMARYIRGMIAQEYAEAYDYIKVISVHSLEKLRGMSGPMLVDNAVFCTLAAEARKLREEKEQLEEKIEAIKKVI